MRTLFNVLSKNFRRLRRIFHIWHWWDTIQNNTVTIPLHKDNDVVVDLKVRLRSCRICNKTGVVATVSEGPHKLRAKKVVRRRALR